MIITEKEFDETINGIYCHVNASCNNDRISRQLSEERIKQLYEVINSAFLLGVKIDNNVQVIDIERIRYAGDLFRVHSPHVSSFENIDTNKEIAVGEISCDGSCKALSITEYDGSIVSFSKSYDFTRPVYYHINENEPCNFIHINTNEAFGIDVYSIIDNPKLFEEQEVLFPLSKEYLVKEYNHITPKEFKMIMDEQFQSK